MRESLRIPDGIWFALRPELKKEIAKIRENVKVAKGGDRQTTGTSKTTSREGPNLASKPLPKQYGLTAKANVTKKDKTIEDKVAALAKSYDNMELYSDDNIDDNKYDMDDRAMFMVSTKEMIEPEGFDLIEVKAHVEYEDRAVLLCTTCDQYAITDGGADSGVGGHAIHVESYTGRHANLVGFDPATTIKEKLPIVTGLLKVMSHKMCH